LFGEISSYSYRGGGVDYDVKKEDGTYRLPQCDLTKEQITSTSKVYILELIKKEIGLYEEEIKELKELELTIDID
jgi:hypothetical protein